jgi:hypothetical protein
MYFTLKGQQNNTSHYDLRKKAVILPFSGTCKGFLGDVRFRGDDGGVTVARFLGDGGGV